MVGEICSGVCASPRFFGRHLDAAVSRAGLVLSRSRWGICEDEAPVGGHVCVVETRGAPTTSCRAPTALQALPRARATASSCPPAPSACRRRIVSGRVDLRLKAGRRAEGGRGGALAAECARAQGAVSRPRRPCAALAERPRPATRRRGRLQTGGARVARTPTRCATLHID